MLNRFHGNINTLRYFSKAWKNGSKRYFTKKIHVKKLQLLLKADEEDLVKRRPNQKFAASLEHALRFSVLLSRRVFDETVQIQLSMNLDARKADQQIRANIYLPWGTGKNVRVLAFVNENKVQEAKDAGADLIADADILNDIKNGVFNFDRVVATPDQMRKLKDVARILGPHGLMPNPKMGTLTLNIKKAIVESKAGQVPIRLSKDSQIMGRIGNISMGEKKLYDNVKSFIHQIRDTYRPKGCKEIYFLGCVISTSCGRGYRVLVNDQEPWITDLANLKADDEEEATETKRASI